jgi:hypothetical protein
MRYARAVINATSERWKVRYRQHSTDKRAGCHIPWSCGLSLEEQRNFGSETDRKRAMAGFATAIVVARKPTGAVLTSDADDG